MYAAVTFDRHQYEQELEQAVKRVSELSHDEAEHTVRRFLGQGSGAGDRRGTRTCERPSSPVRRSRTAHACAWIGGRERRAQTTAGV